MKRLAVAGMLLAWGLLAPGLPAQEGPMGGFGRGPSGLDREGRQGLRLLGLLENDQVKATLGLSEQQATRLREILLDTAKSAVKTRAEAEVHGIELAELLRADKPDHDAVLKKAQEISELRGEMMKQHLEALLAAKDVLTPEQQKKIRSFMGGRLAQGPGWRGRWEGRERRMGQPPRPPAPPQAPPQPRNE